MNWKAFAIGAAAGLIGAYMVKEYMWSKENISAEKVLANIKKQFKEQGPIRGSWIHTEAEQYRKGQIHYSVYKGGISKQEEGKNKHFEFIADATTGTILEVNPLEV